VGHLWCIDPTKRGDISAQLAMRVEDGKRVPIPHKRIQAVEPEKGDVAVDNPNSGVVWHYSMFDQDGDGEIDFEEEMHRSCGTVAIKDNVLYVSDFSGMLHCLDAKGKPDGQPIVSSAPRTNFSQLRRSNCRTGIVRRGRLPGAAVSSFVIG
jgi:outer membrane protein assembly factor BamB